MKLQGSYREVTEKLQRNSREITEKLQSSYGEMTEGRVDQPQGDPRIPPPCQFPLQAIIFNQDLQ
jgi:hypothetical protein